MWCGLFNFFFSGIVGSFSVCPIESKMLCADHPMLNRKPSTEIHAHTIILGSNHRKAVVPGQVGRTDCLTGLSTFIGNGPLLFLLFVLTFGPIEIKAIDLTCALVLERYIIIMLLIFDILPYGPLQRSSSVS